MRVKAIWILCAVVLGGTGFVLSGCGGDKTTTETVTVTEAADSDGEAMTDTAMTETDAMESETETSDTDTTLTDAMESETETTGSEDTDTGTDFSGFATSENCREFLSFASAISSALSGSSDTDVQAAADAMQKFADEAPDEIEDDFRVLADAYEKIADALEGVDLSSDTPPAEAIAKLAQLSQEIDSAALAQASANISAWTQENCSVGG
jgi:hypothetical protein